VVVAVEGHSKSLHGGKTNQIAALAFNVFSTEAELVHGK